MNMDEIVKLRQQLRPFAYVAPHALEVAFWVSAESKGQISEDLVVQEIVTISDDYITPYTILFRLQNKLSGEEQMRLWPFFEKGIREIDKRLMCESTWPYYKLLDYGYNDRAIEDLHTHVQKLRRRSSQIH